jgi:exopolysaccharide biosynthesis protein
VEADAHSKQTLFGVDTTRGRRLTPSEYYAKSKALVVVNGTFFSYATNQSLNVVIKNGKLVGYNIHTMNGRGKDTFTYRHPVGGALGISRRGKMDVAWLVTDSSRRYPMATQSPVIAFKDSLINTDLGYILHANPGMKVSKWKMRTAMGGGPVLLQNGEVKISNNEEMRFGGKAIDDKHPRTAIGYTKSGKLIILVVQGRFPNIAEGATLTQEAQIFKTSDAGRQSILTAVAAAVCW